MNQSTYPLMTVEYRNMLERAQSLPDIFEVVKTLVRKRTGHGRGGLMLGMANLGNNPQGFFGGFFAVGSNVIVLNTIPLQRIKEIRPELYKPYVFYLLLHEYLHTLGYLDETVVRSRVYQLAREALGEEHPATQMAADMSLFVKDLVYPDVAWRPEEEGIELVEGFDRSSVSYIA